MGFCQQGRRATKTIGSVDVMSSQTKIFLNTAPQNAIWGPQNKGNAGKLREIQGLLLQNIAIPRKGPIQGTPGNSFWRSQMSILG